MKEPIIMSWSGGKDSALALRELQQSERYHVSVLLTTVTGDYDRISMHGVRRELLKAQAQALGIPLETIIISANAQNGEYEEKMEAFLKKYQERGVSSVCFGDIFLEDLKDYRENNLARINMQGVYPIWKRNSTELANSFIDSGFKAIITCIDSEVLDKKFAGRIYNRRFLSELPSYIDPCGENGEFHTFVFDGPVFKHTIGFLKGEVVLRDNRFYFCDLLPV